MSENLNEMLREFERTRGICIGAIKQIEAKQKPVFGTKEWAIYNENILVGCSHNCRYCYAKAASVRLKRMKADDWQNEVLRKNLLTKKFRKRNGRIMFPSSHDITTRYLKESMAFLENMLIPGNEVLIASKPHMDCVKAICDDFSEYKDKLMFRFTIGSADSSTLKFWEPNAPDFNERLECLKYAFSAGFRTSVSCEPMLDGNSVELIETLLPFVTDSIWLGKPNRLMERLSFNGEMDSDILERARQLTATLSDDYIRQLYQQYKDNPKIKWKDSIKRILGISIAWKAGMDI